MNIHSNARTCPNSRARIAEHVRAKAWCPEQAFAMGVSLRTGYKWARRFREQGEAGLFDRSSRPHRIPARTSSRRTEVVLTLRRCQLTAREIAAKLHMPRSTVSAVLKRQGVGRLRDLQPLEPVVRYEHSAPGDLVHLDVKKLGRFRAAGHRVTGDRSRRDRGAGWEFVHVAVDDHSRLAYVEVLANEQGPTTAGFLRRAAIFFRQHRVRIRRVLTDNAKNYTAHAFGQLCEELAIGRQPTQRYRPCTNGKAERFIQTLLREWAYKASYSSSARRRATLPRWLHRYNHRRPHGGIGGQSPIARVVTQR